MPERYRTAFRFATRPTGARQWRVRVYVGIIDCESRDEWSYFANEAGNDRDDDRDKDRDNDGKAMVIGTLIFIIVPIIVLIADLHRWTPGSISFLKHPAKRAALEPAVPGGGEWSRRSGVLLIVRAGLTSTCRTSNLKIHMGNLCHLMSRTSGSRLDGYFMFAPKTTTLRPTAALSEQDLLYHRYTCAEWNLAAKPSQSGGTRK